jgi:hypothetical protein
MEKTEKKERKGFIRVTLLSALLLLGAWIYQQHSVNYQTLEISSQMTESLLDHQIALTKDYAQKVAVLQEHFKRTEDLLAKVQEENQKLNEQIALLSHVSDLQSTVDHLKVENAQVLTELKDLRLQLAYESRNLNDINQGRDLIKKFKNRIHSVKSRIKELRTEAYVQKAAAQNEKNRMGLMLGNNGFMTRNGQMTAAAEFNLPAATRKEVHVNVKFVK